MALKSSYIQDIADLFSLGETILDLTQARSLTIQILNPPHSFNIADLPQISLGSGEICVS